MVTAAQKAKATAPKTTTAPEAKAAKTPEAKAAPAKSASKAAVKPEAKPAATAKTAKEPKPKDVIPYATALNEYRELKKAVSDDFSRLCYDARLKEPKNSKTPEEATAKVESVVAAYREFARVLASAAPKRS